MNINGWNFSSLHRMLVLNAMEAARKIFNLEATSSITGTYGEMCRINAKRCEQIIEALAKESYECSATDAEESGS